MSCGDCKHWLADDEEVMGECRRYPPTIILPPTDPEEVYGEPYDPNDLGSVLVRSVCPVTTAAWTCGEFLAKPRVN
jgi:hypothetical protein